MGSSKAYELAMLGQLIGAGEAFVLGLVYRMVVPERFEAEVAARRFMRQMMALNNPTEDATRCIGVFLKRARPEGVGR